MTTVRAARPDNHSTVTYGTVEGRTFRWTISTPSQRLRKWDAWAKDCQIYDAVRPHIDRIEVLDKTEQTVYSLSAAEFDRLRWLLTTRAGNQWAVDRRHWQKRQAHDETH